MIRETVIIKSKNNSRKERRYLRRASKKFNNKIVTITLHGMVSFQLGGTWHTYVAADASMYKSDFINSGVKFEDARKYVDRLDTLGEQVNMFLFPSHPHITYRRR